MKHLGIVLIVFGVFLFFWGISPTSQVNADGDGTSAACQTSVKSPEDPGDSWTYNAGAGNVVTGVCIKSGDNMFGGNKHSTVLVNGTYEDGCYKVSGIGTQEVKVERLGSGDECQSISHVDVVVGKVPTSTPTQTATTPASTNTPTATATATGTTPASTNTPTATATKTATPTATGTLPASTNTPTATATKTAVPTNTTTVLRLPSATPTKPAVVVQQQPPRQQPPTQPRALPKTGSGGYLGESDTNFMSLGVILVLTGGTMAGFAIAKSRRNRF